MIYCREIIVSLLFFVISMAVWVLTHKRQRNDDEPLCPYINARFEDAYTSISEFFNSLFDLLYEPLFGLLQKTTGFSDKKSGNYNSYCKSKKTHSPIRSLKSGVFSLLHLYIFFPPGFNSNISTVKYNIVSNPLKPCAL